MNIIRKKHAEGFTLLELLITVAVAVIIATVAVPSFRIIIANNQIESTANALRNKLVTARNMAIETTSLVAVTPVDDWNKWELCGWEESASSSAKIYSDSTKIEFTQDGSIYGDNLAYQVFSVCYDGSIAGIRPKAVVVSPGGLVLVKDEQQLIGLSIDCSGS